MDEQTRNSPDLTALERAVLEAALAGGDHDMTDGLHAQVEAAKVTVRTPSGVGFVAKLKIPDVLCLSNPPGADSLPVVFGEHPDLPSGAEFILQVKDGRLNSIEAFCYEGMWPRDESLFSVKVGL